MNTINRILTRTNNADVYEFIILAYLITWLFWTPLVLKNLQIISLSIPQIFFWIGGFGPVISAIIITRKYSGNRGIMVLFHKLIIIKVGIKWYIFSLLLPLLIVLSVFLGLIIIYGSVQMIKFNSIGKLLSIFIISIIPCANEELAWRGFTLPRLQNKNNALISSIIIGFFWGLWHLPLFLIQLERSGGFPLPYILPGFVLMTIFLSVIYTFQYNSTRGSILIVTLFHTSLNTSNELFSSPIHSYDKTALFLIIGLTFMVAFIILIKYGGKNLSINPRLTT